MRKLLLPIIAFALVLSSCTDNLTSLNENPKGASDVPGDPLFTNAQVSLGTYLNDPNVNTNIFKYMAQYWAATTYADESQYNLSGRGIPSNLWSELYRDVLNDLEQARTLVNENEVSESLKKNKLAQIEILQVLTYYELVTIFGDVPYSEALDPENAQPAFDDQQTIYADLMSRLDAAISQLDGKGFTDADVFYGGTHADWEKFANSLKMRMAITIADADPSTAQTAFEEASPNAFTANADNATIQFTNSPPHTNPVWEALVQSGRNDYVPANTLIDIMNNLDDPRRDIHFTLYNDSAYVGGTYGESNDYAANSHIVGPVIEQDFEGMILEYAEVEFIRAEGAARGWNTGVGTGLAADHYENAIRADMNYWGVPSSDIDDYVTQTNVAYATAPGTDMEKIATQKWLGLYMQGLQGWTEWRRFDHPTFNGISSVGISEDDIPVRFIYPVDEQNLNQSNYEAAASNIGGDETSTLLFWDTGYPSSN